MRIFYTKGFIAAVALVFGVPGIAQGEVVLGEGIITGSLWATYKVPDISGKVIGAKVEPGIAFSGANSFQSYLTDNFGQADDIRVTWEGAVYAPVTGTYRFRFPVDDATMTWRRITVASASRRLSQWNSRLVLDLEGGQWHRIRMELRIHEGGATNLASLEWRTPGMGAYEPVPAANLSPQYYANQIIVIPGFSEPEEHLNYVVAGVGTRDVAGPHSVVIDSVPADIIEDQVWVTWAYSEDTQITVTNNDTGAEATITGTRLETPTGVQQVGVVAQLPQSVIQGYGSQLDLTFNIDFLPGWEAGIGIIVPYVDASQPLGRIILRTDALHLHSMASRVLVYDLEGSSTQQEDILAFFIFGDGETGDEMQNDWYRPNHLWALTGNGAPPSQFDFLQNMPGAFRLAPEQGPITAGNPASWYPNFGREGGQFDIIAPAGNYRPNAWPSAVRTGEGEIPSISLPSGHTWIAFQYYAGNFDEDGQTNWGESGFMMGGGLLATVGSPPTAENLTTTELDYCTAASPPIRLEWEYSGPDNSPPGADPQSAFQVQINAGASDFSSPDIDSGKVSSTSNGYAPSGLSYDTTYYWRVKVWDSSDTASDWTVAPEPFITQVQYPTAVIDDWSPQSPVAGEEVEFYEDSNEGTLPIVEWKWTFQNGNPGEATFTEANQTATTTFTSLGNNTVALRVTDLEGNWCQNAKTLFIRRPFPLFREVSPFD